MEKSYLIIMAAVFLALGAVIGWLLSKAKFTSIITELKTILSTEQTSLADVRERLKGITETYNSIVENHNQTKTDKAVLESEKQQLNSQIFELAERENQLKVTIDEKDKILEQALEKKTAAETSLQSLQGNFEALQRKEEKLNNQLDELQEQITSVKEENSKLESKNEEVAIRLREQEEFVAATNVQLKESFAALSSIALKENNQSFVELAKAKLEEKVTEAKGEFEKKEQAIEKLVKPLGESLTTMDLKIQELENKRIKAYSDIWNNLEQVRQTTDGLKKETTNLVGALKTSHSRGRYGEIGLRRLVEHAGMFEHCDFEEQVSVEDDNGKLRPDMIIKLPGSKTLVVDSKSPLSAYLKIFETDDVDQQKIFLNQHVTAIKDHLKKLSAKAYWGQFNDAPDFVIMYIHIESSYGAALQVWPEMIEEAMKNRIIIATPTVLLSILMGVGYSWNQLKTMENIEAIRNAAVELHDRSATLMDHLVNIGTGLKNTISHYNKSVGSLESNFMPQARKIGTLSAAYTKKQLPEITPLEISVRSVIEPDDSEKNTPG